MKQTIRRQVVTTTRRKTAGASYHHGDLRQSLKSAALQVLSVQGAHQLSFRELARRLGVTTGAPYHHFKDRNDLLVSLAIDGFEMLHGMLEAAYRSASSNQALVDGLTFAYLDFALGETGLYHAMFLPEVTATQDPALTVASDRNYQLVCRVVEGLLGGRPREEIAERTASIWSFLHGVIQLHASETLGRRISVSRQRQFCLNAVHRLLAD